MLALTEIALWLGFELSDNLYVEVFPLNKNVCILRFANRKTGTCIYYRFERYEMVSGGIIMWHGAVVDIPPDYALCDGNNGTPDLRDRFVVAAGGIFAVADQGGQWAHNHDFTGDGHNHDVPLGTAIDGGGWRNPWTTNDPATGTTDNAAHTSPFYALAYIMKL